MEKFQFHFPFNNFPLQFQIKKKKKYTFWNVYNKNQSFKNKKRNNDITYKPSSLQQPSTDIPLDIFPYSKHALPPFNNRWNKWFLQRRARSHRRWVVRRGKGEALERRKVSKTETRQNEQNERYNRA